MADDTYQPLVYMKQEGNELVVASSGLITVESGGSFDVESGGGIDVESGADIDVESGGHIDIADGGYLAFPVVTDTTAANLSNYGISYIANASSALSTFILDAPVAGVEKFIICDGTFNSTAVGYIDASSGISIGSTQRYMSIKTAYATMHLIGRATTAWQVISSVGSTISTGSTA
jgi:hypothetical protein